MQPAGIAFDGQWLAGLHELQANRLLLDILGARLESRANQRRQFEDLEIEPYLALRDAIHIEQIVDHPALEPDIAPQRGANDRQAMGFGDGHCRSSVGLTQTAAGAIDEQPWLESVFLKQRDERKRPADLLITDIFMPVQEGFETISRFKAEFPQTRIIVMSAGNVPGMKHDFLSTAALLGVGATLRKPFDADQLLDAVRRVLQPGA